MPAPAIIAHQHCRHLTVVVDLHCSLRKFKVSFRPATHAWVSPPLVALNIPELRMLDKQHRLRVTLVEMSPFGETDLCPFLSHTPWTSSGNDAMAAYAAA
jgi:hypothetical protein